MPPLPESEGEHMRTTRLMIVALGGAILLSAAAGQTTQARQQPAPEILRPSRVEVIAPKHKDSFNDRGTCPDKKQGGNPRLVSGYLVFDGATDGNRQTDPQLAVGGGHVLTATNTGLIIYTKQGEFVQGASQACFNGGIDPKMFYDPHNKIFGFNLWYYWDKEQTKPINLAVSETSDPRGAWNTYPIPSPNEVDGGGIGFSRKWIGYTYPGGDENTLVVRTAEARSGKPATIFHFKGSLGQPVFSQDPVDDLYFFRIERGDFVISRITDSGDGTPVIMPATRKAHNLTNIVSPPQAPQKGTTQKTASGDRNPKNVVLQGGFLWFSQTINDEGRAAVQWHQLALDGTIVQTGLIRGSATNYIQTSIAVNKSRDVLIGFQETHADMFISPRMAYRFANDPLGTIREIVRLGEGQGATDGTSWGDYSGSAIDGDNLEDLWTIQSITSEQGKGRTVIARLPYRNARGR